MLLTTLTQGTVNCKFKLLLTSRSHVAIKPKTVGFSDYKVLATDSDLETFLRTRLESWASDCLRANATASSTFTQDIVTAIVSRSKGMFLMADLQLAHIEGAVTVREIRELLHDSPTEVNDQYRSYLKRIEPHRQGQLALRAIAWIHLSRHSLTSKELLEALSIRENDARLDAMGMTTIETILSITGGLLTYEKESGIVRLMHETLREFLTTQPRSFPKHIYQF